MIAVAAPVRLALKIGSAVPTTVSVCVTLATFSTSSNVCVTPRLSMTSSRSSLLNPDNAAMTVYGPPMRMPGRKNCPLALVTASYEVPDGTWIAVIDTPGTTEPEASFTTPVIAAVVTPCADARAGSPNSVMAHSTASATSPTRNTYGLFISSSPDLKAHRNLLTVASTCRVRATFGKHGRKTWSRRWPVTVASRGRSIEQIRVTGAATGLERRAEHALDRRTRTDLSTEP